jgi:transposase
METVVTHGAGLDIHKALIVATVFTPTDTETRSFGTATDALLALADWLTAAGVTHVAMEATGVYWKPIYNVLEQFEFAAVLVVNPQQIRGMPGRKTDVQDSQWIASLLKVGVLKGSYIPARPQRELRELVRYRKSLIQAHTSEVNRIQQGLEGANIKISSLLSDVLGKSGTRILQALADGETDPERLVTLVDRRVRADRADLTRALRGLVGAHQQFLLGWQLQHLTFLETEVAALSREIAQRLANFEDALTRLATIPGVGRRVAETIIAECGTDMQRFPSAAQFVSWAGFSPGQRASGGHAHPAPVRKGSKALRGAVVEAGQAAGRTRTYLGAVYHRLAGRRGKQRAAVATGRHILVAAYHILKTPGTVYEDLGANYFDARDRTAVVRRELHRLEALGYRVTLEAVTPAAG